MFYAAHRVLLRVFKHGGGGGTFGCFTLVPKLFYVSYSLAAQFWGLSINFDWLTWLKLCPLRVNGEAAHYLKAKSINNLLKNYKIIILICIKLCTDNYFQTPYLYINKHKHTHTYTHIQTHTHIHTHTQIHAYKQTHTQRNAQVTNQRKGLPCQFQC